MITTCNQFYNPQLNQRCDSKHFFAAIEIAVRQEDVALQIESEEAAEILRQ
jgi:hypothetical protein